VIELETRDSSTETEFERCECSDTERVIWKCQDNHTALGRWLSRLCHQWRWQHLLAVSRLS